MFQELPEANIPEQNAQNGAVIGEGVGKLGRGEIMKGLTGLGKKFLS